MNLITVARLGRPLRPCLMLNSVLTNEYIYLCQQQGKTCSRLRRALKQRCYTKRNAKKMLFWLLILVCVCFCLCVCVCLCVNVSQSCYLAESIAFRRACMPPLLFMELHFPYSNDKWTAAARCGSFLCIASRHTLRSYSTQRLSFYQTQTPKTESGPKYCDPETSQREQHTKQRPRTVGRTHSSFLNIRGSSSSSSSSVRPRKMWISYGDDPIHGLAVARSVHPTLPHRNRNPVAPAQSRTFFMAICQKVWRVA